TGRALASGLGSAINGIVGALGGPWGVAVLGAIAVLSSYQQASQETAQHIKDLQSALDQSNGAYDANVQKVVQARLEQNNLAESAKQLGVSQEDLSKAVLDGGKT